MQNLLFIKNLLNFNCPEHNQPIYLIQNQYSKERFRFFCPVNDNIVINLFIPLPNSSLSPNIDFFSDCSAFTEVSRLLYTLHSNSLDFSPHDQNYNLQDILDYNSLSITHFSNFYSKISNLIIFI